MSITASLPSVQKDLLAAEERAKGLIAGISDSQANWRPHGGGSWSIVQCTNHLARTNRLYAAAMGEALKRSDVPRLSCECLISSGWFGTWFIRSMEPPARTKWKARATVLPPEQGSPQETLEESSLRISPSSS